MNSCNAGTNLSVFPDLPLSADGAVYHPITYSATSSDSIGGTRVELDSNGNFEINVAPGTAIDSVITVSWSWPFEVSGKDAADTYMSTLGAAATYSITASATATQID